MKEKKVWIQNLLIIILAPIIFFSLLEGILWTISFRYEGISFEKTPGDLEILTDQKWVDFYKRDPKLPWSWLLIPGASKVSSGKVVDTDTVTLKVNSQGLRGPEFELKKPENIVRIVTFGDSGTFGWNLATENTYPYQLQQILNNEEGSNLYQVINAGILGYTSYQGLNFFKNYLLAYQPDIITTAFGWNDHTHTDFGRDRTRGKRLFTWKIFELLNQSRVFQLLNRMEGNLSSSVKFDKKREKVPHATYQDYEQTMLEFTSEAQKRQIKIVLLTRVINFDWIKLMNTHSPSMETENVRAYRRIRIQFHLEYNEILREISKEHNIPLIDLEQIMQNYPPDDVFYDSNHFNQQGSLIAAQEIYKGLKEAGLLKSNKSIK